jgi:hypothetical protein
MACWRHGSDSSRTERSAQHHGEVPLSLLIIDLNTATVAGEASGNGLQSLIQLRVRRYADTPTRRYLILCSCGFAALSNLASHEDSSPS